jgi:hypothetical protein
MATAALSLAFATIQPVLSGANRSLQNQIISAPLPASDMMSTRCRIGVR